MTPDHPQRSTLRVPAVSAEAMRTLALLHDDGNPIHLDPLVAEAQGLGDRVVNPGGANLGYVLNAVLALAPGVRVERIHVTFRANVFAGDDVTATAEIDEPASGEPGPQHCRVKLEVDGQPPALEGTSTITTSDDETPPPAG